jgi:hypothetical protein
LGGGTLIGCIIPDHCPARYNRSAVSDILDDDRQRALIGAAALEWAALRPHLGDRADVVATILERRFEALHEAARQDQLWAEICGPDLLTDVAGSAALMAPVMRAVGAMVWYTPDAARIHGVLRTYAPMHGLANLAMQIDIEIAMAFRFFQMRDAGRLTVTTKSKDSYAVPDTLVRVLGDRMLASQATRERVMREARTLFEQPQLLLGFCDRIAFCDKLFALNVVQRLATEAPRDRDDISRLPDDVLRVLGERLSDIAPQKLWRRLGEIAGGGANALASVNLVVIAAGASDPNPTSPDYTRRVRQQLADVMAELGLPLHIVTAWVAAHRRRVKQLNRHLLVMERDVSLQLFGVIVTVLYGYQRGVQPAAPSLSPYR